MLITAIQQSDSVIHINTNTHMHMHTHTHTYIYIYIYILSHILFHFGLSQDVEYNSLCYTSVAQSCPTLCDLWTVAHHAPLSLGFSRQEYWSALPFPPPGDLPDPGIEPMSPISPALASGYFTTVPNGKLVLYSRTLVFIHSIYTILYIHSIYTHPKLPMQPSHASLPLGNLFISLSFVSVHT